MDKFYLIVYTIIFSAFLTLAIEVEWQNPFPPSNLLYDVHCPSKNTAIAIGKDGIILRTTDNGNSWRIIKTGVFNDLGNIFFIDSVNGWICGLKGSLLKTKDGGITWENLSMDTSINLNYIYSTGLDHGWLRGYVEKGGNLHISIYQTKDGGKSWQKYPIEIEPDNRIGDFIFFDSVNGIGAKKGGFARTTDGGITWNEYSSSPFSTRDLQFFNQSMGWAAGANMWKTTDSGNTWTSMYDSSDVVIENLHFINTMYGWGAGTIYLNPGSLISIIYTQDGGKSWSTSTMDRMRGSISGIHLYDQTTGFAVGNDSLITGIILQSKEDGTAWELCSKGTRNDLNSVFAIDSQTCFAAGFGGIMLKTIDGGKNWEEQRVRTDSAITGMYFVNRDTGWAVGWHGYIIKTIDGGENWFQQNSNTTAPLYRVYFVNSHIGYAVGDSGAVVRTFDGGTTWQPKYTQNWDRHSGLCFPTASTGFITPMWGGRIFHTRDSGTTWDTLIASPEFGHKFLSIDFADSLTGYALSKQSYYTYIFKTTDGGESWDSLTHIIGLDLSWVHVRSKDTVYVCGSFGNIQRSVNGGKNWEFINDYLGFWTEEHLQCIRFAKSSHVGWTVGTGGTIIKMNEKGITAIDDDGHIKLKKIPNISFTVSHIKGRGKRQTIHIEYRLLQAETVSLKLYTIKGSLVSVIMQESYKASGNYSLHYNVPKLSAGVYFCNLETTRGMKATEKFEIVQ